MVKTTKKKILFIIANGINELVEPYFHGVAAQLAFYLFLSALPLVTLVSQLLGVFSLSLESIKNWANLNISSEGMAAIEGLLVQPESGNIIGNIILLVTALWSASKAQYVLCSISDYMDDGYKRKSDNITRRIRSLILIIFILGLLVLALVFLVYAPVIWHFVLGESTLTELADTIWALIRWLVVFAVYFGVISLIYYVSPTRTPKYRNVIPGAIFSSVGFIVVTWLYTSFANYSLSRNILYGSMSNVVMLLVWLLCMAWVILGGLVFNNGWTKASNRMEFMND